VTYKQALRGLFASGTSEALMKIRGTKEKVGRKQGLNFAFIGGMSSTPQRGANR